VDNYKYNYTNIYVPQEVYKHFHETFALRGQEAYEKYQVLLYKFAKKHPGEYERYVATLDLSTDKYIPEVIPNFEEGLKISTRKASGKALNDYMLALPNLVGGSADVAGSVITAINGGVDFTSEHREGHNINWGIREFAMASAQNGMLLHGGIRTYVGCFFVFADYMKNAIRMAALSHLPAIYLFSHDSIAVGEDGPTHQPIEQLAMLRSTPNLNVIRPCDIRETYAAWRQALLSKTTPTAIILSRQDLPLLKNSSDSGLTMGAYIVSKEKRRANFTLIATGSEVSLAIDAQTKLLQEGIDVRVVSMPCWEYFEETSEEYKEKVFGVSYKNRISLEMLSTFGWAKYAKHNIGIDVFGASAPAKEVLKKYHFTVDDVVRFVKELKD
jgi:transketolase